MPARLGRAIERAEVLVVAAHQRQDLTVAQVHADERPLHPGRLLERQVQARHPQPVGRVAGGGEPQHAHGHHVADGDDVERAARRRGHVLGAELARPGHGREGDAALRGRSQLDPRLARAHRHHDAGVDGVLLQRPGARRAGERFGPQRFLLGDAFQVEHLHGLGTGRDLRVPARQRGAEVVEARGVELDGRAPPALPLVHRAQPLADRLLGGGLQARIHGHFHRHAAGLDGHVAVLRDELPPHLFQVPPAGRVGRDGRQRDRLLHLRVVVRARDVVVGEHAIEHVRLPPLGAVGVPARIDARGVLGKPRQDGGLAQVDVPDVLVEVVERCLFDAVVRAAEIDLVQVEEEDVVLGEVLLQAHREQDLLQLPAPALLAAEEEVLHHLLGDGRGPQPLLPAERVDDGGADERERVEPGVLVEVLVLGRDHRLHQHARDLVHRHDRAALAVELPHDRAVLRHHLGGRHRVVVLHAVEGGDLAREVEISGHEAQEDEHRGGARRPGGAAQPDLPAGRSRRNVPGVVVRRDGSIRLHLRLDRLGGRRRFRGARRAKERGRAGGVVLGRRGLGRRRLGRGGFWLVRNRAGLLVPPRAAPSLLFGHRRRDALRRGRRSRLLVGQGNLEPLARRHRRLLLAGALLRARRTQERGRAVVGDVVDVHFDRFGRVASRLVFVSRPGDEGGGRRVGRARRALRSGHREGRMPQFAPPGYPD